MDFVVDCSIVASFLLPDEQDKKALKVLNSFDKKSAIVPALFFWEIGNVLNMILKRKRASQAVIQEIIKNLQMLPIHIDSVPDFFELNELIALSQKYSLSAYDAAYLRVAKKFNVPLITLDNALSLAAKKEDIIVKI